MQDKFVRLICLCIAVVFLTTVAFGSCSQPANPIEAENCLPGNPSSQWYVSGEGDPSIQGFATDMSVNVGQTISFKISTTASSYHVEIYRIGYYQGNGARRITTFTPTASLAQGQPSCLTDTSTQLYDCGNWKVSASWAVPSNATSGVYLAHLVRDDNGGDSLIVFVVRNDSSNSAMLFQTSDESWQAYNGYGGHSLYGATGFDLTNRGYKVSYNRPLAPIETETQFFYAEYPMIRWLEANGYDVSYFSSIDAARSGSLIKNHRVYLSVGHDEYVSGPKRANIEAARDAGVNEAFFSGNEFFWKTRWENSIDGSNTAYRTLVCYKETLGPWSNPTATAATDPLDPPTWTGTWRDPSKSPPADGGRPENALTGQLFRVNGPGSDNTNLSILVPAADGKMRFWRNTAIANQTSGQTWTLPAGTLGYEWDAEEDNGFRPAGLFDLSTSTYTLTNDYLLDYGGNYGAGTATHHLSLYRAASGALVFGAGTIQWSWGLDDTHDGSGSASDVNIQQATVNLFADMGVQPATLQAGLIQASASSDTTPPTSVITSPVNGSTVQNYTVITIQGTASDVGGVVAGVEISTDGGLTWHRASGRSSWTYTWPVWGSGTVNIRSRAVDDSGNIETPSGGIVLNVPAPAFNTIWNPDATPSVPDAGPDSPVELGVKFKADFSGKILGIRFYKSSGNTGTHVGNLWSNSGTLLATATFSNETASGWQQANFSAPVTVSANTVYVASYHTTTGHYADDNGYFGSSGVDNPPLHALQDGVSGSNGVFGYGSSSVFPTSSFNASNYWVDVAFKSAGALTSIAVTPAGKSLAPGTTQQFVATGTYADGSTADITAQASWSSSNTGVATIATSGLASAIAAGSTVIQASSGSLNGSTSLSVQLGSLSITTASLPGGYLNSSYSSALFAVGGTAPYSWSIASGSTLPPGLTLSSSGQITGQPTTVGTFTFVLQVSDGGSPTQTATKQFSVSVGTTQSVWSIWAATAVPAVADAGADSPVELGVRFKSDINATIRGIRFYKSAANTGTHVGNLWSSSGSLLATATFTNETASGWQQVNFSTPVTITANTIYIASYHTTGGHYAADQGYFAATGVDAPPLHALQDGVSGGDGVFAYGSTSTFPNSSYKSTNYWVDLVLATPASLYSISVSPTNPTMGVGTSQQFTATGIYSDGSELNITNQVTWSSSNASVATINASGVASALSGGTSTITATQSSLNSATTLTTKVLPLTISSSSLPTATASLPYSATLSASGGIPSYNWSIVNGSFPAGLSLSSQGQISGTPTVPGSYTFSIQVDDSSTPKLTATAQFTISVATTPSSFTVWPSTATPTVSDTGPDSSVELGMRFKSDVAGTIVGIRFYKSAANTGPHVVNLWTNSGSLVASATSSNETASGWQQVNFSAPVSIAANTVYVASYHSGVGHYAADQNYFASSGVDNYPLHALQDGVSGADGLFGYGSTSVFPSSSYRSTNYWVDVAFAVSPALDSITVTPANPTVAVGTDQQFVATGTYSDGSSRDITSQVAWASSNTSVATITSSGLVSVLAAGSSTITASLNSIAGGTTLTGQVGVLGITTATLPTGIVNGSYSTTLSASGGVPPYSWTLVSGTLPSGLTLSSGGILSGTPTVAGTFSFTVQVADSAVPQHSATIQYSLVINAQVTIFTSSSVPGTVDAGADSSVELGVSFKSDVSGQIIGIRFYKSAANVGPHVVNLWTSSGTLLASATSSNETASGWQQVNFVTPVSIAANTVYVASYHVTAGHYSLDQNFFGAAGVDDPPLHAIQNGVGGANGVYSYGSTSTFPNSSYLSSNYWVDVAFQ